MIIPLVDLNGHVKFPTLMRVEARDYRIAHNIYNPDGVVVFYGTEIQGWVNELRNPESWAPGCVAVDQDGNFFEARGGNDYGGAREWVALRNADPIRAACRDFNKAITGSKEHP